MNADAIRILFLKDIFLSRRFLFGYLAGGMVSGVLTCLPYPTVSFIGFLLMITVTIASGIHMIGLLMLGEATEQTRAFVLSLPVSVLDYSVSKIAVVLCTFLIPWSMMLTIAVMGSFMLPYAKPGVVVVLPAIFCFLLSGFTVQLVCAVVTDSVGWTIGVMVAGNIALNVFLMNFNADPSIIAATKSDTVTWPPLVLQVLGAEWLVIFASIFLAFFLQTRKRDVL
jgi:ABC-2 type transport system permease protein